MIKKLDQKIWQEVLHGTPDQRRYLCGKDEGGFPYFVFYYFNEYLEYKMADFHWSFFDDISKIATAELRDVLWIAFRESAKTTIAKFFVLWCICYKKKNYIAWDSYDGTNAEQALFDIVFNLQTNKKIIRDFGRLYKKKKSQKTKEEIDEDAPEMKRGSVFITTNRIKVECFTTQYSARGRVSGKNRPDLFVFDDIENNITKESLALSAKIIRHVDEVNTGLKNYGTMLYLGNWITEEGVIAHIRSRIEGKKGKLVRDIKIVERGQPTWPGKYVMKNNEALQINLNLPQEEHMLSIEQKREDYGEKVFQTEMMNDPGKSGDYYFNRELVREAIKNLEGLEKEPVKTVGEFKVWESYNPANRYGGGGDTAAGNGGDSNASVFFNFSSTPNRIVGTYHSNEISPSAFGHGFVKQGQSFGECYLVPEINNTGYATVAKMIELEYWNMYIREVKNKTTQKMQKEWGYWTDDSNKYEIASEFKEAFEKGLIGIPDMELLQEMYHFTKLDLKNMSKSRKMVLNSEGLATRHFDLLKAAMLGWEARHHATVAQDKKALYKAPKRPDYIP